MIQDYIFTAGSLIFIMALIPAIRAKEKPARTTCTLTSVVLFVFAATYTTMNLWFTAVTTALTASMWLLLLIQRREAA